MLLYGPPQPCILDPDTLRLPPCLLAPLGRLTRLARGLLELLAELVVEVLLGLLEGGEGEGGGLGEGGARGV